MKVIFLLLFIISIQSNLNSQVRQEWVQRYNGNGNIGDQADAMTIDNQGFIYVTGHAVGEGTGFDIVTIKYSSNGDVIWIEKYNGPANSHDGPNAICVDDSNNIYITGFETGNTFTTDILTLKYNSNGILQWKKTYRGPFDSGEIGNDIAIDNNGNVYIAGKSENIGTGIDFTVIKYDLNGSLKWARTWSNPAYTGSDEALSIACNKATGEVYLTGYSRTGEGVFDRDIATVKYNTSGVLQWAKIYDGNANSMDEAYYIGMDNFGDLYVTGRTTQLNSWQDWIVIKYKSFGDTLWTRTYTGGNFTGEDVAGPCVFDSTGIYVTGRIQVDTTIFNFDLKVVKYSFDGDVIWESSYSDTVEGGTERAGDIAIDNNGGIYTTTGSIGFNQGDYSWDYATIKFNANTGVIEWVQRYNGEANNSDVSNVICVDQQGNVYVTGLSKGLSSDFDYVTIKYAQQSTSADDNSPDFWDYKLYQNYPNPFNPSTLIEFNLPVDSKVKLSVYNAVGEEIQTIVQAELLAGFHSFNFNAEGLSSGIYLYKIEAWGIEGQIFTSSKKMIYLK